MSLWKPGAFAGQTRSRAIAGVLLSEVRHERPLSVAPHAHEAPYFSLLLEGSYAEWATDFSVRYEPYTVVFHDALTEHSDAIAPGGCRIFFVELLSPWAQTVGLIEKRAHLFEMDGSAPTWLVLSLHREFLSGNAASPLTVESVMYDLCAYLSDSNVDSDREPDWLADIDDVLRARVASPIDLHAIARQLSVNPSHLCRTFRRFRRRTLGDHVMGLRVQLVCRMLAETHKTLSEVAELAGFTDQSHMTRAFKRTTGVTPGAYRRQNAARVVRVST